MSGQKFSEADFLLAMDDDKNYPLYLEGSCTLKREKNID